MAGRITIWYARLLIYHIADPPPPIGPITTAFPRSTNHKLNTHLLFPQREPATFSRMLARLRGAIDSQIAAEQAKARPSPSNRAVRRARAASLKGEIEKDPSEFEDSDVAPSPSPGTRTPVQLENVTEDPLGAVGGPAELKKPPSPPPAGSSMSTTSLAANMDLPTEVRVKLRKLEKIEGKYAGACSVRFGGGAKLMRPA